MLINGDKALTNSVKFVSYTGRYPNLCSGLLTLEINGKKYTFGHDYNTNTEGEYDKFWTSGGSCGFRNNYQNSYINGGEWNINVDDLPDEIKKYAFEIDGVFNSNVPNGCCGGCL